MKTYKDIKDIAINRPVVTMGTFDGLHIGHLHVLSQLKSLTRKYEGESVILTFWPHPRKVLNSGDIKLLNTIEEKIDLFERNGIDHLIILDFTEELAALTYEDFVKKILVDKLKLEHLVFGYDHRFGKNGEGTFEKLQPLAGKYHFKLHKLDEVRVGHAVSSTRIRHALQYGHVGEANKMLGYPYQLAGEVVKGEQLGRKIGFPTANLKISCAYKLIPGNGVYACKAYLNGTSRPAMMNIGVKPTVNNQQVRNIEVHLIDFKGDLYGQHITVELIEKIREETKFPSLNDLVDQLKKDKVQSLNIFSQNN
ncbi:MAG TPA: bifunctional riboflavin kinase/FAD synthetase [Salinivirga sp.]|uniref:bifunctional riboflavin kinase/FAD synthetase n=1 Tax=Salinivirga sp. TaxID=1970192 RepID=UPI002B4947C2|nr:bifunctional riboflavin kinase/FAD synthetase [Salinivirga sp.]HKK59764.1 bifunctional riboflavin kinase/FAD synthetase [Salinivirga sp.]